MPVEPPVPVPLPPVPVPLPPVPVPLPARAGAVPPVPVPLPPVPVPLPPVPAAAAAGAAAAETQARLVQVWPEPHLLPQVPQLDGGRDVDAGAVAEALAGRAAAAAAVHAGRAAGAGVAAGAAVGRVRVELQAPSEHLVPEVQVDEQVPSLLQTSVPEQVLQLEPQCWAFEATQEPPQETKPLVQLQVPF